MAEFFDENLLEKDSITPVYTKESVSKYTNHLISQKIPFSYALVDIDNFTYINDTFGAAGGNRVLSDVAQTLIRNVGSNGIVGRNEGDEFVIVLNNIIGYDDIWNICHKILVEVNDIELPEIGKQTLTVTIGLDRYPENGSDFDSIKLSADKALFRGKQKGRNCFIIYLPEKHESIVPKTETQKALASINLHSSVFKFLTANNDLADGITKLFNFMSSYFTVDHICIQNEKKLYFQKIHQISKNREFFPVSEDFIRANINKATDMLYLSNIKSLQLSHQTEFYEILDSQKITSSCFCEISYQDKKYGFLRADMTGTELETRLWEYSNMDLFFNAAKTIALILNFTGKTIKDLV
ncbi:GGDEF domain-containing protein [Treponema sp.]|uniref:GGDEF domain-containing protein n=1 Tax=Treponema sp. TaxID=166 RepID=UPI00388D146C